MTLAACIWSTLDTNDRYLLLSTAFPNRSDTILDIESQTKWSKLLPSTQQTLTDINWSDALGRDVTP